jgi:hypothetical protein
MYTLADTQKALTALALRHGDDAAILANLYSCFSKAIHHACRMNLAPIWSMAQIWKTPPPVLRNNRTAT